MSGSSPVLAVDDNPINLAIIEECLGERFDIRAVSSGTEAVRVLPQLRPDVVLLDVMMPRPDGYEVCAWIKNEPVLRHAQVIMVSARTNLEDRLRGYRAGADDYVTKPFDEDELCAKVTAAVNYRSLHAEVQLKFDGLCEATGDVLELMSHLRDAETGEHLDRMRVYSHLLAGEMRAASLSDEIDDDFLDDLYRASALHDVGKIALPDDVLRTAGPFTNQQRDQMRRHTVLGERILNRLAERQPDVRFFRMAAGIARWHHECYDGSGYPDGLIADDAPLAARIVKVADVFDALTTERPYKPAYSPEHARDLIRCGKGTESDPGVIEAFERVFDDIVDCYQAYVSGERLSLARHEAP